MMATDHPLTNDEECRFYRTGWFNWILHWATLHYFRCEEGIHTSRRCWWEREFGSPYCAHHEYLR